MGLMPASHATFFTPCIITAIPCEAIWILLAHLIRVNSSMASLIVVRPKVAIIINLKLSCHMVISTLFISHTHNCQTLTPVVPTRLFIVFFLGKRLVALHAYQELTSRLALLSTTTAALLERVKVFEGVSLDRSIAAEGAKDRADLGLWGVE